MTPVRGFESESSSASIWACTVASGTVIVICRFVADAAAVVEDLIDGPVTTGSYTSGNFKWDSNTLIGTYRIVVALCP